MKKLDEFLQKTTFNIRRDKEIDLNRRGFIVSSLSLMGMMFMSSVPLVAHSLKKDQDAGSESLKIVAHDELQIGDSKPFLYPNEHEPAFLVQVRRRRA